MYERLQDYDSIDRLMMEHKKFIKDSLNRNPLYLGVVTALKKDCESYKIRVFVKKADETVSRYMSTNGKDGSIQTITSCENEDEPNIAIKVNEEGLLQLISRADEILREIEQGRFKWTRALELSRTVHLHPRPVHPLRHASEFVHLYGAVRTALEHYSRRVEGTEI